MASPEEQTRKRRLHAYYFGFEPTEVDCIDAVLEAVALAGHGFHNTEDWAEHYGDGPTAVEQIQSAAASSATHVAALQQRIERLEYALRVIQPFADCSGGLGSCGVVARDALADDDEAASPRMGERS